MTRLRKVVEDIRLEMPINVTVEEPWTGVVRHKTESDIIARVANIDHIATNRVDEVILRASSDADNIKVVAV